MVFSHAFIIIVSYSHVSTDAALKQCYGGLTMHVFAQMEHFVYVSYDQASSFISSVACGKQIGVALDSGITKLLGLTVGP